MSPTEIALIVMAAALCILVLALIPTFLTIKRAAASVGELAETVRSELEPALRELTGVLAELKVVSGGIAEHTDDVKCFMSALGETGTNLHTINRAANVVSGAINTTTSWTTGAKVAGKYLVERYLKKKGGM